MNAAKSIVMVGSRAVVVYYEKCLHDVCRKGVQALVKCTISTKVDSHAV